MIEILQGDALEKLRTLPDESVHCCVTSPPYWGLRDYGTAEWEGGKDGCDHATRDATRDATSTLDGTSNKEGFALNHYKHKCLKCGARRIDSQLGLEKTPEEYVAKMVDVFREVRRVLRKDGALWLNLGDSYARSPARGVKFQSKLSGNGATYLHNQQAHEGNRGPEIPPGLKEKDLVGIPWRVAFALQADGWWLRSDIIWNKSNCMPESVLDRPTRSHEYVFLMTKCARYYYDADAIKEPASEHDWESRIGRANLNNKLLPTEEINGIRPRVKYTLNAKQRMDSVGRPLFKNAEDYNGKNGSTKPRKNKQRGHSRRHDGFNDRWDQMERSEQCSGMRNKRDVWTVAPANYPEAHFATFPPDLIKPCILAGSPVGGTVLDPFAGSGTTGQVSLELGRKAVLIELNPKYIELIRQRCDVTPGLALE